MRKRVPLIFSSDRGWTVDLPTFGMVPGSFLPIIAKKIEANGPLLAAKPDDPALAGMTVLVELPDDTPLDDAGQVHAEKLRERYRNHPRFGSDGYTPPALAPSGKD